MIDLLGEALLEHIRRGLARREPATGEFVDWLREVATPPEGVELYSADGSAFTGLVIVDRNRPVLMIAARQAPVRRPYTPSSPTYSHGYPYRQTSLFEEEDDEEPPWRRHQPGWRG